MFWYIYAGIVTIIAGVALYVAYRFAMRTLQMDEIIRDVDDRTAELIEYCESLKEKSLMYHSPEILQFHRLVVSMAAPLNKIRTKVEAMNG